MWKATVRDYGDGLQEATVVFVSDRRRPPRATGVSTPEEKMLASLRRAKAMIRRKIMAAKLDHLLTLTFRQNVDDFSEAYSYFRKFIRKVRERYGRHWHYVMVPERQRRGAWHFHLAVHGFQDVHFLRKVWVTVLSRDGLDGNIDVSYLRGRKLVSIVRYMTKYITKNLENRETPHSYYTSKGIIVPIVEFSFRSEDSALVFAYAQIKPTFIYREHLLYWMCTW